ncbi:hypothetical protein AX15_005498 [Amanita polypyramis BW_CC]|nr:hypothetical protein AX15_005498 [Amanita polypyramis BW_CC]
MTSDNDVSIFQFDSCSCPRQDHSVSDLSGSMSPHNDYFVAGGVDNQVVHLSGSADKGKGVTRPLPIPPLHSNNTNTDIHSISSLGSSAAESSHSPLATPPLSPLFISPFSCISNGPNTEAEICELYPQTQHPQLHYNFDDGKGKEKEPPSFLTSPVFNLTDLDHTSLEHSVWSSPTSSTPGPFNHSSPSSPTSLLNTPGSQEHPTSLSPASSSPHHNRNDLFPLKRMPSRRRSLSNLSLPPTKSQCLPKIKVKWNTPRIQHNISRAFLFKKRDVVKLRSEVQPKTELSDSITSVFDPSLLQYLDICPKLDGLPCADQPLLRTKGRSKSLPEPLSALDYIPTSPLDIYEPIPLVIKNYFDEELPRELQLRIFKSLVEAYESDFQRLVTSGKWSVSRAASSKGQWIGRVKGIRELFKLRRVSKSWQGLVFDGQLWDSLDLHAFPTLPGSTVLRLSEAGCSFIRTLNLAGHFQLHPDTLINLADSLCISPRIMTSTRLTSINLQGCASLTTHSLHHLLILSESLQTLNVKGLTAVTNITCDILAIYCPLVTSLNMSRCPNMDAEGIRSMAYTAFCKGEHLKLKTLRVSGLKNISDGMMSTLGKAAPYLEVLDLSYARQLHNSAIQAFVNCDSSDKEDELGVEITIINSREAGRENGNRDYYSRRVTHLRHLSLSYCILLTDMACANLAHSVPCLESFEMAGIGADLKDEGLIRLFRTTPYIKRIDLEDALDMTDKVLETITPYPDPSERWTTKNSKASKKPGHALEHLIISYASQVSDEALLSLIQNCPRLRCLEADNTRMGPAVLREFVQLSRERNIVNAKIVAVDCRGISDSLVNELSESIRPRMGWRSYAARKLTYLDARDGNTEELKIGQDECDEKRVVVKSFYTWQTVDSVRSAREKRRRSMKRTVSSSSDYENTSWRTRWWSPGGRRFSNSGRDTPQSATDISGNDGCILM